MTDDEYVKVLDDWTAETKGLRARVAELESAIRRVEEGSFLAENIGTVSVYRGHYEALMALMATPSVCTEKTSGAGGSIAAPQDNTTPAGGLEEAGILHTLNKARAEFNALPADVRAQAERNRAVRQYADAQEQRTAEDTGGHLAAASGYDPATRTVLDPPGFREADRYFSAQVRKDIEQRTAEPLAVNHAEARELAEAKQTESNLARCYLELADRKVCLYCRTGITDKERDELRHLRQRNRDMHDRAQKAETELARLRTSEPKNEGAGCDQSGATSRGPESPERAAPILRPNEAYQPTCKNHPESHHELFCRACFDDLTAFAQRRIEAGWHVLGIKTNDDGLSVSIDGARYVRDSDDPRTDKAEVDAEATDQERALYVIPEMCKGVFWDDVRKRLASEFFRCRIRERAKFVLAKDPGPDLASGPSSESELSQRAETPRKDGGQ